MEPTEGVIKFQFEHLWQPLTSEEMQALAGELMAWRAIMRNLTLIGQVDHLYDGAGYGNVSARLRPYSAERGQRSFLVSGTQTGGLECSGPEHFCRIDSYRVRSNSVRSRGPIEPSSESMTHGTIYDLDAAIRFVFHGHSPLIWRRAETLRMPISDRAVAYGTVAMAEEVKRLYRCTSLADCRIFAMGGHEDGIVAFGPSALAAGTVLLDYMAQAYAIQAREKGLVCDEGRRNGL